MHVGKIAPVALYRDLQPQSGGGFWVPRCLTVRTDYGGGTFGAAWDGLVITSEVQFADLEDDVYHYHFIHPTLPSYTLDFQWRMTQKTGPNPVNPNYWVNFRFEALDGGVLVGVGAAGFSLTQNWWPLDGDDMLWFGGIGGVPPYYPGTLDALFQRFRWSKWEEQSNYHPYRWYPDPGEDIEGNPIELP